MSFALPLIGLFLGALVTYLILYSHYKNKTVSADRYDAAKSMFEKKSRDFDLANDELKEKEREIGELSSSMVTRGIRAAELNDKLTESEKRERSLNEDVAGYEAVNRSLMEKLSLQEGEMEKLHDTSTREFEKTATKILEEKSRKLTEANHENIQNILNPLTEKLAGFREAVEENYDKESMERRFLKGTVQELVDQASRVSKETSHLAEALKGQTNRQGNWGEVILERVLESSGLVRDMEYFVRKPFKSEDGEELLPDITVQLPGDRTVLIDSRVSFESYDLYLAADTDEERAEMAEEHLESIRSHVWELSEKHYDDLESSLDFTMMFIPIEPAFQLAIQSDPDLLTSASSERILIISPSNVIAVLKIVADLWTRERQNKSAVDIVKHAEILYEKFVGFAASMEVIGESLEKTQNAYSNALDQFRDGRGNLVGQTMKLKELGVESDKELPAEMIPLDNAEDLPLRLAAKNSGD